MFFTPLMRGRGQVEGLILFRLSAHTTFQIAVHRSDFNASFSFLINRQNVMKTRNSRLRGSLLS